MAIDKLHAAGGRQCIDLLNQLDAFNTKYSPDLVTIDGQKTIVIDDINEFRLRVRDIWQRKPETIDEFLEQHPALSEENKKLVLSWKKCIKGDFVVVKFYPAYAVFYSVDTGHMYAVKGLNDTVRDLLREPLPMVITTTLFPYKSLIIWDGMVAITRIRLGNNMAQDLIEKCERAHAMGEIIFSF
jgi:hypothetical protein